MKEEGVKGHFYTEDRRIKVNIDEEIQTHIGNNWRKAVLGYKANNEDLPF
jgi:hypothetical protein